MKKPHKVEFYVTSYSDYSWRIKAPNNRIIFTPHEGFTSLANAVRSFKTVCKAMDAQTVFEVDGDDDIKARAHKLLTR